MILRVKKLFSNAITLHPWLIVLKKGLNEWREKATLAHEQTHVKQQQDTGWFVFMARWLLFKSWRVKYELAGFAKTIDVFLEEFPNGGLLVTRNGEQYEPVTRKDWVNHYVHKVEESHNTNIAFGKMPSIAERKLIINKYLDGATDTPKGSNWPYYLALAGIFVIIWNIVGAWVSLPMLIWLALEMTTKASVIIE